MPPINEFLTRKLGPLPAWGWGIAVGGGILFYRQFIRSRDADELEEGTAGPNENLLPFSMPPNTPPPSLNPDFATPPFDLPREQTLTILLQPTGTQPAQPAPLPPDAQDRRNRLQQRLTDLQRVINQRIAKGATRSSAQRQTLSMLIRKLRDTQTSFSTIESQYRTQVEPEREQVTG